MKDFAEPGRDTLIFFDPGDKVRWHGKEGPGPYYPATVVRTARSRVLIKLDEWADREVWAQNLHLSHDPEAYPGVKGAARREGKQ